MGRVPFIIATLTMLIRLAVGQELSELKPMVSLSLSSHNRIMNQGALVCQSIGLTGGSEWLESQIENMLMLPSIKGIDPHGELHFFWLTTEGSSEPPTVSVLATLDETQGLELLESLTGEYRRYSKSGSILTFSDPVDSSVTALLTVALAADSALISTKGAGLHWLAAQLRDGTLPVSKTPDAAVCIRFNPRVLAPFTQVLAERLLAGFNPDIRSLKTHADSMSGLLSCFDQIEIDLEADARNIMVSARLTPESGSRTAAIIADLIQPQIGIEGSLPRQLFVSEISNLYPIMNGAPGNMGDALEQLAESTQLIGLRVAPDLAGLMTTVLSKLSGYRCFILNDPQSGGLCQLQTFGFQSPEEAQEILKLVEAKLEEHRNNKEISIFPARVNEGSRILGYQTISQSEADKLATSLVNEVSLSMLKFNQVEISQFDRQLIVVRGPLAAIDGFLKNGRSLRKGGSLSPLERVNLEFNQIKPKERIVGGGQFAIVRMLRSALRALPGGTEHLGKLPAAGDNILWQALTSNSALKFNILVPHNEIEALKNLSELNKLSQEILSNFILINLGKGADDID